MSLGLSLFGSAAKLPDLVWVMHSVRSLSCVYLHVGLISGNDIKAEEAHT